jgi:hypothetical protein
MYLLCFVGASEILLDPRQELQQNLTLWFSRGWGVLTLPLAIFKHASSPQEALGIPDLDKALLLDYGKLDIMKLFGDLLDITPSIRNVGNSSVYHPHFGYGIAGPGTTWDADLGEPVESVLRKDDESENEQYYDAQENFDQGRLPGQSVLDYAMSLGIDIDNLNGALFQAIEPLLDEDFRDPSKRHQRQEWILAMTSSKMQNVDPRLVDAWRGKLLSLFHAQQVAKEIEDMKRATKVFHILANIPPKLQEDTQSVEGPKLRLRFFEKPREFEVEPTLAAGPAKQRSQAFLLPDHSAILRTYQFDIELMPPTNSVMRTICKSILHQRLTAAVSGLRPFERLNMLAVIDELSLVIIGSQVGRCALITPTRLDKGFSSNGPVVMFRIDRILPSKTQEDGGARPTSALLGMAVSPLQADESPWAGWARKRHYSRVWRLILHYYDHTILSYELSRTENDVLLVGRDENNVFPAL